MNMPPLWLAAADVAGSVHFVVGEDVEVVEECAYFGGGVGCHRALCGLADEFVIGAEELSDKQALWFESCAEIGPRGSEVFALYEGQDEAGVNEIE